MTNAIAEPTIEAPEQLYTVAQISEATQQSEETILQEIHAGRLRALNVSRGNRRPRWRITKTEYGRYLVSMMHG